MRTAATSAAQQRVKSTLESLCMLVIDEVSMVPPSMLAEIDQRLRAARPRFASVAFGGVALLATGDFLQLKPVANASLASALPSAGRELWVQHFKSVVLLRTNMRAAADPVYSALLERVRMGACTLEDVALLNTRVLSATNVLTTSVAERVVPVLVQTNESRAALNRSSVCAAAVREHAPATVWRFRGTLTRKRGALVGISALVKDYVYALPDST